MGRTIRKVPENWEHRKDNYGKYIPMHDRYYMDVFNEWLENHKKWEDGTHEDLVGGRTTKEQYPFYALWSSNAPDPKYYQHRKYNESELTHIQLYEDTTEGTPISPVFRSDQFDELCQYAADNCSTFGHQKTTKEAWKKMLSDGFVYHQEGNAIFM